MPPKRPAQNAPSKKMKPKRVDGVVPRRKKKSNTLKVLKDIAVFEAKKRRKEILDKKINDMWQPSKVQPVIKDFNTYIGTDASIVKGVRIWKGTITHRNLSPVLEQSEKTETGRQIASMQWVDPQNEEEIIYGLKNQKIYHFSTNDNTFRCTNNNSYGKGDLVSLFTTSDRTVMGLQSGEVVALKDGEDGGKSELLTVVKTFQAKGKKSKTTLESIRPNPLIQGQFVTGGTENDFALWDINKKTSKPIYKAENNERDLYDILPDVLITHLCHLEGSIFASVSRNKYIKLHDVRVGPAPTVCVETGFGPLTCVSPYYTENKSIVVGDSHGRMMLYDLRRKIKKWMPYKETRVFKGFGGAIKDIVVHPTLPVIVAVASDRAMHMYHVTKSIFIRHYLKSRANCALLRPSSTEEDLFDISPTTFMDDIDIDRELGM